MRGGSICGAVMIETQIYTTTFESVPANSTQSLLQTFDSAGYVVAITRATGAFAFPGTYLISYEGEDPIVPTATPGWAFPQADYPVYFRRPLPVIEGQSLRVVYANATNSEIDIDSVSFHFLPKKTVVRSRFALSRIYTLQAEAIVGRTETAVLTTSRACKIYAIRVFNANFPVLGVTMRIGDDSVILNNYSPLISMSPLKTMYLQPIYVGRNTPIVFDIPSPPGMQEDTDLYIMLYCSMEEE